MAPDASGNLLTEWSRLVAGVLCASGLTRVFVSPGSRSTPYLLALLETEGIECLSVIDERAAAFAALGVARKTGRPAAVLCTSGTAPTHHFPAVVEAHAARLLLVVLSADRPRREQDRGAAQTIDQTRLFGNFARFVELGDPTPSAAAFRSAARKLSSALNEARRDASPLHVNLPADKPLEPAEGTTETEKALANIRKEVLGSLPRHVATSISFEIDELRSSVARSKRPAVLAGPLRRDEAAAVEEFARQLGAPLFAEASSNAGAPIPAEFGLVSLAAKPDLIVHFGGPLTSTAVQRFLENSTIERVQVTELAHPDPAGTANLLLEAAPAAVARDLLASVPSRPPWTGETQSRVRRILDAELEREGTHSEPRSAHEALSAIPEGVPLLLGNSLSIRLADWVFGASGSSAKPEIFVQRGVNGIDGLIAGAQGIRLASERGAAVILGDVSLAHDLTSLSLFREETKPLVVIVLDNAGGRLFDHLPARSAIADEKKWEFFRTDPDLDLEHAARAFRVGYAAPELGGIATAIRAGLGRPGTTLVHIRTDSTTTAAFLARCRAALAP